MILFITSKSKPSKGIAFESDDIHVTDGAVCLLVDDVEVTLEDWLKCLKQMEEV